jgi:hypothetical protein
LSSNGTAPLPRVETNEIRARSKPAVDMRYVLSQYDYTDKDKHVVGEIDRRIVGPATEAVEDGDTSEQLRPWL